MLLPDPSKFKDQDQQQLDTNYDDKMVFFSHSELDAMAKHFIGNMQR